MSTRETIGIVLALVMGALTVAQVSPAAGEPEIFIERTKLIPPTLTATVGERVTFVNRSGRTVHVDFMGDGGRHRVFQVPNEIWAIFHRGGLHPYEVHFSNPQGATLRGTVEAVEDPSGRGDPHTCDSLTVMGECIAP